MTSVRQRLFCLGLFLVISLLFGCSPKSTPPGPDSVGGSVGGALYSYHYWEGGLAILIWHDFSYGASGCSGTASTEDPVYRLECDVEAQDGRRFTWTAHTSDGVTGQFWIDGQSYDLARGAMFLVSSQDGPTEVVQLQRDLSQLTPVAETFSAMAVTDVEVADFVSGVEVR